MKRILLVAVLVAGLSPSVLAQQGPFGLVMGASKQSVEKSAGSLQPVEGGPYLFLAKKVPAPSAEFEGYVLQILPTAGVCQIRGVGVTVKTSSHGVELVRKFNDVVALLESGYGKYGRGDYLRNGSIWDEPEDWTMALLKKERVLQAAWDASEGSTMKNGVTEILLSTVGLTRDSGYVVLQYKFENQAACEAELKALAKNIL